MQGTVQGVKGQTGAGARTGANLHLPQESFQFSTSRSIQESRQSQQSSRPGRRTVEDSPQSSRAERRTVKDHPHASRADRRRTVKVEDLVDHDTTGRTGRKEPRKVFFGDAEPIPVTGARPGPSYTIYREGGQGFTKYTVYAKQQQQIQQQKLLQHQQQHGIQQHGIQQHGIQQHGIQQHGIQQHGSLESRRREQEAAARVATPMEVQGEGSHTRS